MAVLEYRGPALSQGTAITTRDYATTAGGRVASSTAVDQRISSNITGYATQAYADSQDSTLALKTYVDSQDANKVKISSIGQANGPVALDSSTQVASSLLTGPTKTQALYSTQGIGSSTLDCTSTSQFVQLGYIRWTVGNNDSATKTTWFPYVNGYWEVKSSANAGMTGNTTTALPYIEARMDVDGVGTGSSGLLVGYGCGAQRNDWHPCNVFPSLSSWIAPVAAGSTQTIYFYGRTYYGATSTFSMYMSQAVMYIWPARM